MKIIAIGGGDIDIAETLKIDREIIALSGKKSPALLFIPTASFDAEDYVARVQKHFGKRLSCNVDVLLLWNKKITKKLLEEKIMSADIIYVGGGNTMRMIQLWKKIGLDKLLRKAMLAGKILSGVSAGAICWFKYGNSDSRKSVNPKADYIRVTGLGFLPLFLCPHFDAESDRQPSLKKMLKKRGGIAIALDNCSALEIIDDTYRIITSRPGVAAYKCFWVKDKYHQERMEVRKGFQPLGNIRSK